MTLRYICQCPRHEMTLDCVANHSNSQGSFRRILGFNHHWLPLFH